MNGFLYFIPGIGGQVQFDRMKDLGLAYAFTEGDWIQRQVTAGPVANDPAAEQPGVLIGRKAAWKDAMERFGYFTNRQTWTGSGTKGGFLVGVDNNSKPGPSDLVRNSDIVDGYWLHLNDGNKWHCPTARKFDAKSGVFHCNLPAKLAWSDELDRMAPVGIERRYEALWNLAARYFEAASTAVRGVDENDHAGMSSGQCVRFEFPEADKLAMMAMQTNYRVWIPEIELLDLWCEQTRGRVLDALLDNPTWQTFIKKKLETAAADYGS